VSACDTCRDPGHCCAGFQLNSGKGDWQSFWVEDGPLMPLVRMAQMWLPFVPMIRGPIYYVDDGAYYQIWYWGCPLLGEDGRCTDYENRPDLCVRYEPKSDPLCVEFGT
jgi:Fe-S-cluster containining protein